jgi:hypothetical protein
MWYHVFGPDVLEELAVSSCFAIVTNTLKMEMDIAPKYS